MTTLDITLRAPESPTTDLVLVPSVPATTRGAIEIVLGSIRVDRTFVLTQTWTGAGIAAQSVGGTVTREDVIVPAGQAYSYKFTGQAAYWNRIEWGYGPGRPGLLAVQGFAKHDSTGLTSDARIHVQIIDPDTDPLYGGTALAEWVAVDSTAWQTAMVRYMMVDDRPLIIRICQKRTSGNSYARAIVRPRGFSGVMS